ncbi:S1 RNA-binding domain-containing protein [Candidatus Parvarchaeota archaeon]|nr:S1 RNA-binding domain-containing protein [Candidatus Parvarchaeota archaeon]
MNELEIGKIYICKVKKLLQHGVIVEIDSLGIDGFIHISELSKRWVSNIKDVAKENENLVCKLIKKDGQSPELSVKRVSDSENRQALREWSISNRIMKILENSYKTDFKNVKARIESAYGSVFGMYTEISKNGTKPMDDLKLKSDVKKELADFIDKTKKKITLKTELKIQSYSEDGVERIKKLLTGDYSDKDVYSITYVKAPIYLLKVNAGDTKKTLTENRRILQELEKKSRELAIEFSCKELK